jgi:hypothetical protein
VTIIIPIAGKDENSSSHTNHSTPSVPGVPTSNLTAPSNDFSELLDRSDQDATLRPSNEQRFKIHKKLICSHSLFFEAAFTGNFLEGQTQRMTMEDTKPEIFHLLFQWLYSQKIKVQKDSIDLLVLVKLWDLADLCLMPNLQNEVVDLAYRIINRWQQETIWVTTELFNYLYSSETNGDNSLMKLCLIDSFCYFSTEDSLTETMDLLPSGAWLDVVLTLKRQLGVKKGSWRYYKKIHSDEELSTPRSSTSPVYSPSLPNYSYSSPVFRSPGLSQS